AISVFPNPVTDHVMVVYSDVLPAVCTLRDALGNALLTQEIVGNTVIDMQSLPAGIYYIDVLRGEAAFGISIMKQ
ncbi:MAG TPA: T9SS type A sorting domain-containing protein, partial [Chitinophagales bacterium]|nr:T9SS type A sorting domain-containing protein [Chitinophagales bacterium]